MDAIASAWTVTFLEKPTKNERCRRVCECLIKHGYIITNMTDKAILCVAPVGLLNVYLDYSAHETYQEEIIKCHEIPYQCCILSTSKICVSAMALYSYKHGISLEYFRDFGIVDVTTLSQTGFVFLEDLQDEIQKRWKPEQLEQDRERYFR